MRLPQFLFAKPRDAQGKEAHFLRRNVCCELTSAYVATAGIPSANTHRAVRSRTNTFGGSCSTQRGWA
jgi:hypothetical protein